ncbi:Mechanosensitive ion channel protein 4 [Linum perenne]
MHRKTSDDIVLVMDPHHHLPKKPPMARSQSMTDDYITTTSTTTTATHNDRPSKPPKVRRRIRLTKPKARLQEYNYPPSSSSLSSSLSSSSTREAKYDPHKHKFLYSESSSSEEDDWSHDDYDEDGNGFEEEEDEEEEEDGRNGDTGSSSSKYSSRRKRKKKYLSVRHFVEWVVFIIMVACVICSLTIERLGKHKAVWKWCLMVMVTICGPLVSGWVMSLAVFAIQRNFMLREKLLYFVLGLRKSIRNCVWLALILLCWTCVFSPQLHQRYKLLDRVYKGLVALLVAAVIWLGKIVLVKTLASSFHVARYFDRMKESVFHQYVLDALSGPPKETTAAEDEAEVKRNCGGSCATLTESRSVPAGGRRSRRRRGILEESLSKSKSAKDSTNGGRVDMVEELRRLSLESTRSAWSMRRLVNYIMSSGLSTISKTVDDFARAESEIGNEWDARTAAKRIFKNVAKPGAKRRRRRSRRRRGKKKKKEQKKKRREEEEDGAEEEERRRRRSTAIRGRHGGGCSWRWWWG